MCVCVCMCVCAHPLGGAGSLQVSLTLLCGFGPGRPGASAGALVPFSPLAGDVPPGHRGRGGAQKSPDTPGSPEGNTGGPGTASSEPLLPS